MNDDEIGDEYGDEEAPEEEVKGVEGECDLPNLTQLCSDNMSVQFCTQDLEWSECESSDVEDKWSGIFGAETSNATPAGNLLTDVAFEWPENSATFSCTPGTYSGKWSCKMSGISFTGPVKMTLTETDNGEFLKITDGELNGKAKG